VVLSCCYDRNVLAWPPLSAVFTGAHAHQCGQHHLWHDRGEEPTYCGVTMSELIEGEYGIGDVVSLLWFRAQAAQVRDQVHGDVSAEL